MQLQLQLPLPLPLLLNAQHATSYFVGPVFLRSWMLSISVITENAIAKYVYPFGM